MALNMPLYQVGASLSSVVITGQTVSLLGALSDSGTSHTLSAYIDDVDVTIQKRLNEISAVNGGMENYVRIINALSWALRIVKPNAIAGVQVDPSPFFKEIVAGTFDYWKVVYINGVASATLGSEETVTIYGVIEDMQDGQPDKGRQTSVLSFRNIEVISGGNTVTIARVVT